MSQIKVTPSFLIRLMQSSKGLSDQALMDITKELRSHDGVLTGDDVDRLFKDQADTSVTDPTTLNDQSSEPTGVANVRLQFQEDKERISKILSGFLSSIDQNLTDAQVYKVYTDLNAMIAKAKRDGKTLSKEDITSYLEQYVSDNRADIAKLTSDEIMGIVEEEGEVDEHGTQTFIERFPGHKVKDVFTERESEKEESLALPLSMKQQGEG